MENKPYANKMLFLWSYVAGMGLSLPFTLGVLIAGHGTISEEHIWISIIGGLFSTYAFIVFAVLIYKMWKKILES